MSPEQFDGPKIDALPVAPSSGESRADRTASPEPIGGIESLPSREQLFARYHYQPPSTELPLVRRLEVNLNDPAVVARVRTAAETLLAQLERGNSQRDHDVRLKERIVLAPDVRAEINVYPSSDWVYDGLYTHILQVRIVRDEAASGRTPPSESPEWVADFFAYVPDRRHGDWRLHHRIVADAYRGQGIGSSLLQLMEQIVAREAVRRGELQQLTIDASQVEIILFALKRGYRPASAADAERLQSFLQDDGSRFLLGHDDSYVGDRSMRVGVIQDALTDWGERPSPLPELEPMGIPADCFTNPRFHQFVQRLDPIQAEGLAYTVNLAKRFEP